MTTISTPDLCDQFGDQIQIAEPLFRHYGGLHQFGGPIATVKCFEDNSKVGEMLRADGEGRILVVDGGGSRRRSLLGDKLGQLAVDNGWQGLVIYGSLRDVEALAQLPIGVLALGSIPRKTDKRGAGQSGVAVEFAGLTLQPGDYLYVDETGMIASSQALSLGAAAA